MHITFAPRGILEIDDARIIYRNFRGEGSKFNREGDRNFALVIPNNDIADSLIKEGWNVKIKPPREEGDEPFMYLPVKIKFNERGPHIYLCSGSAATDLDETTVGALDEIDIRSVSMDIRPYDWEVNGKEGRTAYLQSMWVTQEVDRFAARMAMINGEGIPSSWQNDIVAADELGYSNNVINMLGSECDPDKRQRILNGARINAMMGREDSPFD